MKPYTHYIFDLDSTLLTLTIDWGEWFAVIDQAARDRGIPYSYTSDRAAFQILADIIRHEGDTARHTLNKRIRDAEIDNYHGFTPIPHVIRFLQNLPADIPKYIWTANSLDTATLALTESGLAQYFTTIAARDNSSFSKPDPAGFHELIFTTGVAYDNYVLIGDSTNDQAAAQAAGIDFVHVDTIS